MGKKELGVSQLKRHVPPAENEGGWWSFFVYMVDVCHDKTIWFGTLRMLLFLLQYDLILKKISSRKTLKSSNFMTSYFESRATAEAPPPLFFG